MEQIKYNFVNRTKKSLYSHKSVSNYNQLSQKNYGDYLKQNNKLNVKSVSIYNPNNPLISEISHQNDNNVISNNLGKDMVEQITKYYSSYSSKNNNSKNKYSYIQEDLVNQYSRKQNLQSKNYLDYLQTKRNTYDYKDKVNNDIQKINTDVNEYKYNNKNLYNNLRDKINNSYDKNKLINKLNNSKLKNDYLMEETNGPDNTNGNSNDNGSNNDHDISIEYTNAPIIHSKRSNNDNFINICTSDNNDFNNVYKYSKIQNINSFNCKNNNDYLKKKQKSKKKSNNNSRINYVNSPSYFSNTTNKKDNIDIFNNNNYDISITNTNYNNFLSNEKKYSYLINRKKQDLLDSVNTNNISKNDIKYEYDTYNNNNNNLSLEKYQRNSNNDNNNNNLNKSKIRVNINNNQNSAINNQNRILKTEKKTKNELKNTFIPNNINVNVLNKKINISNVERKNNNNYNSIKLDPQLKRYNNKSKKDIFHNSEYSNIKFNIPQKTIKHIKQIKSNSPNSKSTLNYNNYIEDENSNFQKLSMNYSVNLNNFNNNININNNINKNNYNANIFDPKYSYNNNNIININENMSANNNKKNILNRQKILMVDDKNYRMISPFSSVDIDKFEKSDLKYNIKFNSCIKQNSKEKISNLSDYYNEKEGFSYLEPKNKTSRQDNKYSGQKLLISNENLGNRYLHSYKSTKNILKKNDSIYNVNSERKTKCTSPQTNNIFQYNLNNNKINNNYNIINIDIDKYKPTITPKKIVNKNDSNNAIKNSKMVEYIFNTNPNNNEFLRNENKKLSNVNSSKIEDCSLLKSINNYKQTYNNPVKLYKKEIKEIRDKRINKERKIYESINNINSIYNKKEINNYSKKENNLNMNCNNRIKKYNSLINNNKKIINNNNSINSKTISNRGGKNKNNNIFYYNNIKNNNNFININNNIPDLNLLNLKNNSISISSAKKEKYNLIDQDKNAKYISSCESKEKNIHHKNNRSNLKNVADELFEKNKNLKNINKIKPVLGRTKINNNYLSPDNGPSFIKTNTIRFNEKNMNKLINSEDISKSYKNILYKSNNESNYENTIKKQLVPNYSEVHIFGNKVLTSQNMNLNNTGINNNNLIINNSTEIINKDNINNYNGNNPARNSNISNNKNNNNRGLIKTLKITHEISNLNLANYYKKINVSLNSANNSIQIYNNNYKNKNKNLSPIGVYIKPYCALPPSKSKSNIKSKSEIKVKNRNKKNNILTSLNKKKLTSKSLNSELNFNTSTFFYLKGEYIKNHMNSLNKLTAGSLNTSAKNNFSLCNLYSNDFSYDNLEKEKYDIQKQLNDNQMKKINNQIKKTQSFIYKIYNYFIKQPKIEVCHFIKIDKRVKNINNNKLNTSSEKSFKAKKLNLNINVNTNNTKRTSSLVKEIFTSGNNNNYEEEKINENSQNGFLVTFGEANSNKKNIENNINNINNISRNNIESIINNLADDSDYEIYKSIQQSQNINENNILNIYNAQFDISNDNQDYDSFLKDKSINKNLNNELLKSTNQYNEYNRKMSKTFKNKSKSKYNLENTEKGLKILGKIAQRRGINNRQHLDFNSGKTDKKYNIKIYRGTKKYDEFDFEREIMLNLNNNGQKSDSDNKRSRSVNKDIMKGISKIANILGKSINDKDNNKSIDTTHVENLKMNNDKIYHNNENIKHIINYDEKILPKIKTFTAKANNNIYLCNTNINDNIYFNKNIRYSQPNKKDIDNYSKNISKFDKINISPNLVNKYGNELINSYNDRNLRLKDNSISDSIINHYNELISYNEEEQNSNKNKNNFDTKDNDYLEEELGNYLKQIKIYHSSNDIKHDMIYLLNLLVQENYQDILKQITEMILFEKNNSIINENKILNKNDKIIENEHLFTTIIFKIATTEVKYTNLYTKFCNDLNNNILFELREQKNEKNNKERNLKLIINDECISILNNFKTLEINNKNNDIKIKDKESEEYILLKNKIIGYINFVYELINVELLKQQFGLYVLEQFYKIYNDNSMNICSVIKDIFLEGIIILINKLGKLVLEKNNKKLIENINNYIKNNLYNIINNKNNIPNYLKYKIINLLIKRDNQWKEHLFEILKEEEKEKNKNILSKIEIKEDDSINGNNTVSKMKSSNINKNNNNNDKEKNEESINVKKAIIEEDLINYISYYTEENNKGEIDIKKDIDKSYNWKAIDELINTQNFGLESIINCFLSICTTRIYEEKKLLIANDYIKNIIEYYSNNLSQRAKDSIHNEMIKTFLNINQYVNANKNMHKILGNLLFILIDNKLYHIKYFNNYLKLDKQTQINLAIITKYCIISSGKFAKKYLNDFKQTKLFINNEIFNQYVNDALKDLFYFFK